MPKIVPVGTSKFRSKTPTSSANFFSICSARIMVGGSVACLRRLVTFSGRVIRGASMLVLVPLYICYVSLIYRTAVLDFYWCTVFRAAREKPYKHDRRVPCCRSRRDFNGGHRVTRII